MKLSRAAYAFVEPGGAVPVPDLQAVPPDIVIYFGDHRSDLLERAMTGKVAEAHFADQNAANRFQLLATGTNEQFTTVAADLAKRLHQNMDARSRRGFFVAATFTDGTDSQAMVLKLDASPKKLAAIGGTGSNRTLLSVEDLLDMPGDLQKGAVFPDPRSHSDVCVADKNREAALYYLTAIEVGQHELPTKGIRSLLAVVGQVSPAHVEPVTKALESVTTRTPAAEVLKNVTPPIPPQMQADINGRLAALRRPVADVDPTAYATQGIVDIDGIVIRGPAARIREDVSWRRDPNGTGFVIEVRVAHQPTKRYE